MKRWQSILLFFGCIGLGVFIVTWSWVYTPHGRLDYPAATLAKLSSWQSTDRAFDASTRDAANAFGAWLFRGYDTGGVSVTDIDIPAPHGTIAGRVYTPDEGEGPFPAMLHYHGGGFWMGNNYTFDGPIMELAAKVGMVVFSIQYRLAPEHPYPAGVEDSYRALQWVYDNAGLFGVDPQRLGVMGASAGANIAAATTLLTRDRDGPKLLVQHLIAPVVDLSDTQEWPSFEQMGDNYVLKATDLPMVREQYIPNSTQRLRPYASPLLADSHSGLPEALIVANQFDPLRDQALAYTEKLEDSGIPVTLKIVPRTLHGFMGSRRIHRETMKFEAEILAGIFETRR